MFNPQICKSKFITVFHDFVFDKSENLVPVREKWNKPYAKNKKMKWEWETDKIQK